MYIFDIRCRFCSLLQLLLLCVFFSIWFLFAFCKEASEWRKEWSFSCASLPLAHSFYRRCHCRHRSHTTNKYDLRIESHFSLYGGRDVVYCTLSFALVVCSIFFSLVFLLLSRYSPSFYFIIRCLFHVWNMCRGDSAMHMLLAKQNREKKKL